LVYSAKNLESEYGDFGAGAVKITENIPKSVNLIKNKVGTCFNNYILKGESR
jgi:hypothetical protein